MLLGNTRIGGTYVRAAFMQVSVFTSEPNSPEDKTDLSLILKGGNFVFFMLNDSETTPFIIVE